jgi:hypothetical protein
VVTVYFKTVSRFVCKRFTKPGIGLWINENCLGSGHGLFQMTILTLTWVRTMKPCSQQFVPCSRSEFNTDRRSIPQDLNPLVPSDPYMGRTAQLTSRCCILNTYSTNIHTEYFKCAA